MITRVLLKLILIISDITVVCLKPHSWVWYISFYTNIWPYMINVFHVWPQKFHMCIIANQQVPMNSLQWRYNGLDGVSNDQPHDCLLNRLFRRRSKKTSKLRVTGFCAGNSPVIGEFPEQMPSNAENVSIWWRHHVNLLCRMVILRWNPYFYVAETAHSMWLLSLKTAIANNFVNSINTLVPRWNGHQFANDIFHIWNSYFC